MDIIHAPGKPILPRLFAYARPITFGFFFLIIIIYLFCVLARWSRRSYITTASAFFEFRNDNGLKLARFDYRYRMPERISWTVPTLAYPWDHKENCVNKTINKSKKNVNYFCVNAYRRVCALTHTRTNKYCTAQCLQQIRTTSNDTLWYITCKYYNNISYYFIKSIIFHAW